MHVDNSLEPNNPDNLKASDAEIKITGKNPSQSLVKGSESRTDVTIDEGNYRAEPTDMTLMKFSKCDTQNQANCVGLIVCGQTITCETDFVKTHH